MARLLKESSSIFLDMVRGISAQLVVIGHSIFLFDVFIKDRSFAIQELAVLVFFILSGFIISYTSYHKKLAGRGYTQFLIDRFSRIYPPLVLCLIFTFLIDNITIYFYPNKYDFYEQWSLIDFIGTLLNLEGFPIISKTFELGSFGTARPTWSLAVEWWIYVAFGYIYFVLFHQKIKLNWVHVLPLVIILLSPIGNIISEHSLTISWIFGTIVFWGYQNKVLTGINKKVIQLFLGIIVVLAMARLYIYRAEFDLVVSFLLSATLLLALELAKDLQFTQRIKRIIKLNAQFSYTLYLIHFTVLYLFYYNFDYLDKHYLFFLSIICSNLVAFSIGILGENYLTKRLKTYLYHYFQIKKPTTKRFVNSSR